MGATRREFLQHTMTATAAMSLGRSSQASTVVPPPRQALRILILGGTGFIGPHEVRYAQSRGHTVTLFNRGQTNPNLFPNVEKLRGDRNNDLTALEGREWDVVIDNAASIPRWVRQSAQLLKDSARQYLFVSTISVYADNSIVNMDESGPLATTEDETVEEVTGQTYGPLKALSEQEARNAFGDRATIVRPGLIVGPGDPTDRFTYWPVRIDRGGDVLAPGNHSDPVQIIDVRDLTHWMIRTLEEGHTGTYNATGPASPLSIAETLYGIRAITPADVSFKWADAAFLEANEVRPWRDMPLWIPPANGMEGFSRVNCEKAIGAGLTFMPLADTARDTLQWYKTVENSRELRWGISAEKEREVLAAMTP